VQNPFGSPGVARVALEIDPYLSEPYPGKESLHEAVPLRETFKDLDDPTVHKAEVTCISRYRGLTQKVDDPIKKCSGQALRESLTGPFGSDCVNDVIPFLPFGHQILDQFGRILKVSVDRNYGTASGKIDAGAECDLLSEVSR
jgi:hypothetical protein